MWQPDRRLFAHTLRLTQTPEGATMQAEGVSWRYTAIAALGLSRAPLDVQRDVLGGMSATDLARQLAERLGRSATCEYEAAALTAWAVAEVGLEPRPDLLAWLADREAADPAVSTVGLSWAVCAAHASTPLSTDGAVRRAADRILALGVPRLLRGQGAGSIFPHRLRLAPRHGPREHVGSFADQIYPVQALSRHARSTGDAQALAAANRCARRLVETQGPDGQWWWHYDTRTGRVVERYPVYSVHQHAMAPMALADLEAAGGDRTAQAVAAGVSWLWQHPECGDDLIDPGRCVVWRKVGRRERLKVVRGMAALTTAIRPAWVMPGVDSIFPPGPIDRECRPYELGWLLYAWGDSR